MGGRAKRQWVSVAVLLVATLGIVGTEEDDDGDQDFRWPCDWAEDVSPGAALVVHWSNEDMVDFDKPGFSESVWLEDAAGTEIPLLRSIRGEGLVVLCPVDGLEPGWAYRWNLTNVGRSDHHEQAPSHDTTGWFQFVVGPGDGSDSSANQAQCDQLALPEQVAVAWTEGCDPCREPGTWSGCSETEDSGEARR